MKILLNDHGGTLGFEEAIGELVNGADTLSVAVSYLQTGGWDLFRRSTAMLNCARMRVVCTDQMGITQPAAVRRAIETGVQIRNFTGVEVYHPKVYIAHSAAGKPTRFLVSSANMSYSAFTSSVEAGVLGSDAGILRTLSGWFDNLFRNRSKQFTPERAFEQWKKNGARRQVNGPDHGYTFVAE